MLTNETRAIVLKALEHERNYAYARDFAAIDAAIAEINAEAQKTPQPDWSKAPEWARWWAMDADGAPYWFEEKPEYHSVTWQTAAGRWGEADRKPDANWRTTLAQRTGSQTEAQDDKP